MTDVLYKIASAIATEEGYWTLNSLPNRNDNPGDLRACPLPTSEAPVVKGFVQFKTPASGIAGLYHQIALDVARGITLRKLIAKWASPTEITPQLTSTPRFAGPASTPTSQPRLPGNREAPMKLVFGLLILAIASGRLLAQALSH